MPPFGSRFAEVSNNINEFYDAVAKAVPSLDSFEPLVKGNSFYHSTAHIQLSELVLVGSSSSAFNYKVSEGGDLYFILPLNGAASCRIGSRDFISSRSHGAMLIVGEARSGMTSELTTLQASINKARVLSTAATMFGDDVARKLDRERFVSSSLVNMQCGSIFFDQAFQNMCGLIDSHFSNKKLLEFMGISDCFYRLVVTSLLPEEIWKEDTAQRSAPSNAIKRACEYIDANLSEPIYMTDLEKVSSLSSRSLQYGFKRQFNCTPMEWIRRRRLELARQRLLEMGPDESITSIAMELGFSSHSNFTLLYKKRFGETPSATVRESS